MKRLFTLIFVASLSWYGMMVLHEVGHCAGTWLTGGRIQKVDIPLYGFSQTFYESKPSPLVSTWGGPVGGIMMPLFLLAASPWLRGLVKQQALFFSGFCLISNGVYIGYGSFLESGDCFDLLLFGARHWQLILFGVISTTLGLFSWHRMGSPRAWFAIGRDGPISASASNL
jgi:hypothetical protein